MMYQESFKSPRRKIFFPDGKTLTAKEIQPHYYEVKIDGRNGDEISNKVFFGSAALDTNVNNIMRVM